MKTNARSGLNWPPFMSTTRSRAVDRAFARWGIVLAGGDCTRIRPLIRQWLGEDRPKEYCTFVGSRSMFQHTIDRACSVIPEEHVVATIGREHQKFLTESVNENVPGLILEQPGNLGAAPGVFLSTAYVLAGDPAATIILLPSDHFVHPEERFHDHVIHAFELAEKHPDKIIHIGAIPDRAETDYDWISPGRTRVDEGGGRPQGPMQVMRFRVKPDANEAQALLRQGALWSTMVLAVKAETLWAMGRKCLPEMMCEFDAFRSILNAVRCGRLEARYEASALENVYAKLAPADFAKDLLQHVPDQSMVLPMDGVDWCDWARPQRISETLGRLDRSPFFPSECLGNTLECAVLASNNYK